MPFMFMKVVNGNFNNMYTTIILIECNSELAWASIDSYLRSVWGAEVDQEQGNTVQYTVISKYCPEFTELIALTDVYQEHMVTVQYACCNFGARCITSSRKDYIGTIKF